MRCPVYIGPACSCSENPCLQSLLLYFRPGDSNRSKSPRSQRSRSRSPSTSDPSTKRYNTSPVSSYPHLWSTVNDRSTLVRKRDHCMTMTGCRPLCRTSTSNGKLGNGSHGLHCRLTQSRHLRFLTTAKYQIVGCGRLSHCRTPVNISYFRVGGR